MPADTSSFFGRGVLLFFTILTNTFLATFEGVQIWDHRPIVEKHFQFAFYRPSAEAIASMICDLPNKVALTACFNIPFYFLANMRRTPDAFFTFYQFAFASLLTGSMLYRIIGALSRTLTGSIAPGAEFILMLVIYTGFVLPIPNMHPWLRWFGFVNPVAYAFESLMINEFSGRNFSCAQMVPGGASYADIDANHRVCAVTGAKIGSVVVNGDDYLAITFQYYRQHLWRNLGLIFSLMTFLCSLYLLATKYISAERSKGQVLIFRRGQNSRPEPADEESRATYGASAEKADPGIGLPASPDDSIDWLPTRESQAATYIWDGISYDIKTERGSKRLLDDVEGYVEPGTLTALMGESGAGKTTLLNVLADRVTTGVIDGERTVDTKFQDVGFRRKVGYANGHCSRSTSLQCSVETAILLHRRRESRPC